MSKVTPLSFPKVNWTGFIKQCQETLGYSPTRGLDSENLDVESPSSFLACLDLKSKPKEHLRSGGPAFNHVHASFMVDANVPILFDVINANHLRLMKIEGKRGKVLLILTGSMADWRDVCVALCHKDIDTETREVFNEIIIIIDRAGFKEIWSKFERTKERDGTFSLR